MIIIHIPCAQRISLGLKNTHLFVIALSMKNFLDLFFRIRMELVKNLKAKEKKYFKP